jgi:hypothetical protein
MCDALEAEGLQITIGGNNTKLRVKGVQVALIGNGIDGNPPTQAKDTLSVAPLPRMEGQLIGMQIGGVANEAITVKGVQMAGFYNVAEEELQGVQIGLLNFTRRLRGVQIGLFNWDERGVSPILRVRLR